MTNTAPALVCTLTEPDLRARKALLRRTLSPFLTDASYAPGASRLVFSKPDVTRQMLEDMISLEQACCPFFRFELLEADTHFEVEITGPEGSETMVRDFFSADDGKGCGCTGAKKKSGRGKTYAFGFVTLCAVCCAVPPTLVALGLVGVATAATTRLWIEGAVVLTILLGVGYFGFQYLKKRQRKAVS